MNKGGLHITDSTEQPGLDRAAAFDVLGRIALAEGGVEAAVRWHQQALDRYAPLHDRLNLLRQRLD